MSWRQYEDRDYEQVVLLHEKMQRRIGREFTLPHPGQRPVLLCMVKEEGGEITNFILSEATMEISAGGERPTTPEELIPVVEKFTNLAQFYSIRLARAFAPKELLVKPNGKTRAIKRILESSPANFTEETELASFYLWIPPAAKNSDTGKVA